MVTHGFTPPLSVLLYPIISIRVGLQHKSNKLEGDLWTHAMEGQAKATNTDVLVFDMADYFCWRSKMKYYLKKYGVWEIVSRNSSTGADIACSSTLYDASVEQKKHNNISFP